jgi:hypothetical protein
MGVPDLSLVISHYPVCPQCQEIKENPAALHALPGSTKWANRL